MHLPVSRNLLATDILQGTTFSCPGSQFAILVFNEAMALLVSLIKKVESTHLFNGKSDKYRATPTLLAA
jgi:hypothetical protein